MNDLKGNYLSVMQVPDPALAHQGGAEARGLTRDGAQILDDIADIYTSYMALPRGAANTLALWAAHAHCIQSFLNSPRLVFCSPQEGCGKTLGLDLTACFAPRPFLTETPSEASLCRLLNRWHPTLLLDEYDNWLAGDKTLLSLLNAGHRRGGVRLRCGSGPEQLHVYRIFGAVALGGIGSLPATLQSRCIIIHVARALPGEVPRKFNPLNADCEMVLGQMLSSWVAAKRLEIETYQPILPHNAHGRLGDNWTPLFAIAAAAGGSWPAKCEEAFKSLQATNLGSPKSPGAQLLADILAVFNARKADKLSSVDLVAELRALDGHTWGCLRDGSSRISAHRVALLLRPYGIAPRTIRIATRTVKGYTISDFSDASARYL